MNYISVKEASKKWGISERRVRILCSEGRVDGVYRSSWAWNIPATAPKPGDGRKIRHIKNFDLRIGGINFAQLETARKNFSSLDVDKEKLKDYFDDSVNRFLCTVFRDYNIPDKAVKRVLSKNIEQTLTYSQHMMIINAKSIMTSFMKDIGFGPIQGTGNRPIPFFNEKRFALINDELYKGIDDYKVSKYRNKKIPFAGAWSQDRRTYDVSVQMETLMVQFENEWNLFNPIVKSAFMLGEMLRIQPFEGNEFLYASIIFAGNLLDGGYPLAVLPSDMIEELKADLSLTLRRGNYNKILRLFETSLLNEFDIINNL